MSFHALRVGQFPQKKVLLHVGCGRNPPAHFTADFPRDEWQEVRLDIDPQAEPDILGSIVDLRAIETGAVDAVLSLQNLEHLFAHEVALALAEFRRVLKASADSRLQVCVPDLQSIGRMLADGAIADPIFMSESGPITPLDMIYGHSGFIRSGMTFMAHKTGFTAKSLQNALAQAGFVRARIEHSSWDISATAWVV